jgi:release factor glutamine methyltransferase
MSVRAFHMAARVYLKAQGIVNPEWQAELLVGGVLGLKRHDLYLESERSVRPSEAATLRDVVTRRANHEPTQYILGQTEFYGLPFKCDRRALIPRPETELLVDKALLALAQMESPPKRVLDLGTGTGCIAVAIAANDRSAHVTATDAAIEPLALAKENAHLNGVADRIDFVQSDLFAAVSGTHDLVVCNPPYIADGERKALMPEVRDFEPPEALFAGPEGLDFIRSVLRSAPDFLVKGGALLLEIGLGQAGPVHAMAGESGDYSDVVITPDYQGHPRVFSARRI